MEKRLLIDKITEYVQDNISKFHNARIQKLSSLKLKKLLQKKNPYLFKAKNCLTAQDLVENIARSFMSSAEETMFGDWLEGLAIFANNIVFNGRKSTTQGIDLEFDKDNTRYIVSIKSGPNWGNSSQIKKMIEDFNAAKRTLHTSGSTMPVVFINGCCYGKKGHIYKNGDYYKYCGQDFWTLISGEETFYLDIIKPLGTKAKEKNEQYQNEYTNMINRFTRDFSNEFCNSDRSIDWEKIVRLNSGE